VSISLDVAYDGDKFHWQQVGIIIDVKIFFNMSKDMLMSW